MKLMIAGLLAAGALGLAFGFWGVYTQAGRTRFDEMDGIIPVYSGYAGAVLIGIALALITIPTILRGFREK